VVGREAELSRLNEWLAEARDGRRQLVFVTGGPGGGKTALVEAFTNRLDGSPGLVAAGQCYERFGQRLEAAHADRPEEAAAELARQVARLDPVGGRPVLAETLGWFTEGFETTDVREAREVLAAAVVRAR
jgi:hypothetical protein